MKLLCLSNGHGEDAIALRILQALQQRPDPPEIVALPIVGEGQLYRQHGIPILGPVQAMPSGGFVYMDGRELVRDLRGGLLKLTLAQLKALRDWQRAAQPGDRVLAVGDIVPLLYAWWSGADYAFVGTAKSDYYLRDEQGWLPRDSWLARLENWSGSDYLPWERWLMGRPRCKAIFPRDSLTTARLRRWHLPVFDLGNPMMDGLEPTSRPWDWEAESQFDADDQPQLTLVLLPGSRPPEAYENWQILLQAVSMLMIALGSRYRLLFLAAIAPQLDRTPLQRQLETGGWRLIQGVANPNLTNPDLTSPDLQFEQYHGRLILTSAFNGCLHQADLALAMAGTATEQFVGLGKPAFSFAGAGPQFTPRFAEAQTRLLGASVTLVEPAHLVKAVELLLNDPDRLQLIRANGRRRMGSPGAAIRIAEHLMQPDASKT
jgi:uncharacterized protein (TIGR03492 family)